MAEINIPSSIIKIYPAANRNFTYDRTANLNIEENIVKISNNIVDYKSYIADGSLIMFNDGVGQKVKIQSGNYVVCGYNIFLSNDINLDFTVNNNSDQYVYLRLEFKNTSIGNNQSIKELKYTDDESTGTYNSVCANICNAEDIQDSTITNGLILAKIKKGTSTLSDIHNYKINTNKTAIEADPTWGLCDDSIAATSEQRFEDWLANYFYIDDGEI